MVPLYLLVTFLVGWLQNEQYGKIHGIPRAEADFRRFFRVTPPVVHQMIKTLHAHGFIDREPGKARSIRLRLTRAELPDLD